MNDRLDISEILLKGQYNPNKNKLYVSILFVQFLLDLKQTLDWYLTKAQVQPEQFQGPVVQSIIA